MIIFPLREQNELLKKIGGELWRENRKITVTRINLHGKSYYGTSSRPELIKFYLIASSLLLMFVYFRV